MFKNKVKPSEVVRSALDAINTITTEKDKKDKIASALDDFAKSASAMKSILYGELDRPVVDETAFKLCTEWIDQSLFLPLLSNLASVPFEAKKDIAACVNNLLRKTAPDNDKKHPFVEHVASNPAILDMLIDGYDSADIALVCGSMLRECVRHESLASASLNSEHVWQLFNYVEYANFDVSSDALATFRDLLTTHRDLVAAFLLAKFDRFFALYRDLLRSPNYVTRRQTLKLLGEIIVHRKNFTVMNKYIGGKLDLMLMMNLLRDKSKSIQYEAFHVLKVFVANPNKPDDIVQILRRNRERLTTFLNKFRTDIEDDQFVREKAYLLKAISEMK